MNSYTIQINIFTGVSNTLENRMTTVGSSKGPNMTSILPVFFLIYLKYFPIKN